MLGMFNSSHWAHDLDNAENKRFVADFEKTYGRLPSLYASQGYDAALLIDAAVRDAKGNLADKEALRKALEAKRFKSVRGDFKWNSNHHPVQNYYLRVIGKDAQGSRHEQDDGNDLRQPRRRLRRAVQDEIGHPPG